MNLPFWRHIANVIWFSGCCLSQEIITLVGKTIERICILSTGKLALELTADEFKTSICKSHSMTISISRDCPFSFAHADQKKQTVIVFSISVAIVIIVVISICFGSFTFQRVDSNYADFIFIFLADIFKFI